MRERKGKSKEIRGSGFDRQLLVLVGVLSLLGVLAVADASSPQAQSMFGDPYYFARQQFKWMGIGLLFMAVTAVFNYKIWRKLVFVMLIVNALLLVAVLLPGVGTKVLGARRWISLGFMSIQPSEMVKLTLTITTAYLIEKGVKWWKVVACLGAAVLMIMLQPDFGTTAVIVGVVVIQMFTGGMPIFYLIGTGLLGALMGTGAIYFSEYRRDRLLTFLELSRDPLGESYHIKQILIALGSGGIWGVGLGRSRQKHLFLPETASDSVFAVIAEEIGFIGGSIIIVLLCYLVIKILKIGASAPDKFSMLICVGVGSWIGVQAFLNLASMVALTPLTGIPLPFFSYGGSSLTMLLVSIGIVLNISRYRLVKQSKEGKR